ncbi:hypothetical protein THRCLA_22215 [Thraustotheca clavata]|uniref:Uncharacterized protein n=1 Tax=Thraustotheca clavata TaxID=74557 RepID=A0A1V9Z9Q9_9STRA|nr:hypothetical protein THRCLA_22215 [Thraustotheca clavata]
MANARDRSFSSSSEAALQNISTCKEAIVTLERRVKEIEWQVTVHNATSGVSKEELIESKETIAQLYGSLDKLQYHGVDGIITADLKTGKDHVREQRKELNRQCESIRTLMMSLHQQLKAQVAATT